MPEKARTLAAAHICLLRQLIPHCRLQLPDVKSGTEPWFELPFVAAAVPEALLSEWEACTPSPELALPPRNSYLPTDFSLRAEAAMQARLAC